MKYTKAVIEKAKNADFVAVASTSAVDRHGEIVEAQGWDIKNFKKNPVLLWAHDHSEMAVGKASKVWIEGEGKRAKLMVEGVIHDATEKARALKQLVSDGIISTMSVGFRGIEAEDNKFTQQELLEVSFVNVPANQQAMITAYKSLTEAGFEKKTIDEIGIPSELLDRMDNLESKIKTIEQAKEVTTSASTGRYTSARLQERQRLQKAIERSAQKLTQKKRAKEALIIKRAIDKLNKMNKEEINGTN